MPRGETRGGAAWLHNMSVPTRSALRCARATLPGRRFHVSLLPGDASTTQTGLWLQEMHACLQRHGMAALAALVDALSEGREPTPRRVEKKASRWTGDPAAHVLREFGQALRPIPLLSGLGVFATEQPLAEGGAQPPRLDKMASLAVLARRAGPLYVPNRPVEPSLMALTPCVLIFPGNREECDGSSR